MSNGRLHQWEDETPIKRLPEIGRLKVGMLSERGYPTSLEYFRATGRMAQIFHAKFGPKPDTVPITFVSDDASHVCNLRYELIAAQKGKGARLYAKGDGRTFEVFNGKAFKTHVMESRDQMQTCMAEWEAHFGAPFQKRLTLRFLIEGLTSTIGEWAFETKAETSIENIVGPFNIVKEGATTVRMIPFDLAVKMHTKFSASEHAQSFPIVQLIPKLADTDLQALADNLQEIFSNVGLRVLHSSTIAKQIGNGESRMLKGPDPETGFEPDHEFEEAEFEEIDPDDAALTRFEQSIQRASSKGDVSAAWKKFRSEAQHLTSHHRVEAALKEARNRIGYT